MNGLDPIERASADELGSLQLARLKETLARVYERVPHYREKLDGPAFIPTT